MRAPVAPVICALMPFLLATGIWLALKASGVREPRSSDWAGAFTICALGVTALGILTVCFSVPRAMLTGWLLMGLGGAEVVAGYWVYLRNTPDWPCEGADDHMNWEASE